MILNLRRIGLYSMSLALILTLSITPISRSEETTPFEEFFKGYEKVWEIPDAKISRTIHAIDCAGGYFVIITKTPPNKYKYYLHDISGDLIWENDNMEIYPANPPLSQSGNRLMIYKGDSQENTSTPVVYDTKGNLLFELPESMDYVNSSPKGKFYYSETDFWIDYSLVVANDSGEKILEKPSRRNWYAEAINDSFLVYDNPDQTEIIKITENGIAEQYSVYEKPRTDKYICQLFPVGNGGFITLRNFKLLSMMNKDLDVMYQLEENNKVYNIAFSGSSEVFCIYTVNWNNEEHIYKFFTIDGDSLGVTSIIFPEGYSTGGDMDFGGSMFFSRFSVTTTDAPGRPAIKYSKTFIVRLSSDFKCIISSAVLENRIYSFGRFGDLLVVSDSTITGWSKKGGK